MTVKYFLSDPTNGNAAYNLVTPDCTGTAGSRVLSSTKFGNLRFYLGLPEHGRAVGGVTEFSSYNNGGSSANAYAYKGTNDGSNHYTVTIPMPADVPPTCRVRHRTGRQRGTGQGADAEVKCDRQSAAASRAGLLINVVVQHTFKELALTGTLQPRRAVVATDKCNVCHGMLGTASGSNTLANAFHSGSRDTVQACVICHDAEQDVVRHGHDQWAGAQRVVPVQAHDPRHPRQLEAPVPVHPWQRSDRHLRQGRSA